MTLPVSEYGNVNHWLANGGGWFFNLDYDKEVLAKALVHKAAELPLVIELVTAERKIVICHADYPHNEYAFDKPIPKDMVIWNRERVKSWQLYVKTVDIDADSASVTLSVTNPLNNNIGRLYDPTEYTGLQYL
ncbi:serine/threonine-protein phosphatase [Escherichia coli UMEA 3889-1]|nr:serine/threonine-protein phosphatase [Escherichia coli UMEA 3889-1]